MEDVPAPTVLSSFDSERSNRFESFVASLRPVFHRADQALRFRAYLRGLLEPGNARKNFETIAAAAARSMMVEANLSQALQHFVSQSPWDAGRLLSALRREFQAIRTDDTALWVVHELAFQKKGVHSIGVHRQLDRGSGRKLNCQVGVFLSQVGAHGFFPLAARLYLPATWLKTNAALAEKIVPPDGRKQRSKTEIALELIDELIADGESRRRVAVEGSASEEILDGLAHRQLDLVVNDSEVAQSRSRLDWMRSELGLDHFEGRTWLGWHHHVSLVFAAYYLLASEGTNSI